MKIFTIALCVMPALAWAQNDETNTLREVMEKADDVQAEMEKDARESGVTRQDCLDAADPELGDIMFPGDPEAYRALVEETCAAFD